MQQVWVNSGNRYLLGESSNQFKKLEPAIYNVVVDQFGTIFLEKTYSEFSFGHKIYGLETKFIKRVLKTYENTTGNLGIILNGVKGTGKTVTAKIISNKIKLPVIIISQQIDNLNTFLNSIQQDIIVFIDEYEKIYDGYNNSLLSVMDGVLNTNNRILFLFTTNELNVERNLLQRPGRIRYIKTYSDLELETINEIVDDLLIHKEWRDEVIESISRLEIITVDIVKAFVEEINIHDEHPDEFKDILNINFYNRNYYNVYWVDQKGDKNIVANKCEIGPEIMSKYDIGSSFYIDGDEIGKIKDVLSENQIVVTSYRYDFIEPGKLESTAIVSEDKVYYIESISKRHKSFSSLVF